MTEEQFQKRYGLASELVQFEARLKIAYVDFFIDLSILLLIILIRIWEFL